MNKLEFKYLGNLCFAIVPVICIIFLLAGNKKKARILKLLGLNRNNKRGFLNIVLTFAGLFCIVLSLLGPQILNGYTEVEKKGLDIYLLIDTSKSMLVNDIKPDRIGRAKKIISQLMEQIEGNRIGFISFTSSAYIQLPLTDDIEMADMFLDVIDTDMISNAGTDIGEAIGLAVQSFDENLSAERVIILLSDGEDQENGSLETLLQVKQKNLHIYTMGIGTPKGGLIPLKSEKPDTALNYMANQDGDYVISRLMPDPLKNLALKGNGVYYQSTVTGDEVSLLINDIEKLKKDTLKTGRINDYQQIYQYFLGVGMILLIPGLLLSDSNMRVKEG